MCREERVLKNGFASGHDFSRAEEGWKKKGVLTPEGLQPKFGDNS
jgi:hypothetical protein